MDKAISNDLLKEVCLLTVFDCLKKFINENADLPNSKIDLVLSIIIQNGGEISKRKRKQVEALVDGQTLKELQKLAIRLIEEIKDKFKIDVVAVMNEEI